MAYNPSVKELNERDRDQALVNIYSVLRTIGMRPLLATLTSYRVDPTVKHPSLSVGIFEFLSTHHGSALEAFLFPKNWELKRVRKHQFPWVHVVLSAHGDGVGSHILV